MPNASVEGIIARSLAIARRPEVILFLAFLALFGQFIGGVGSSNTISRIGLTANLVQEGRLDIGGYETFTYDKALHDGRYYTDKAPGLSFLAIPAAYLFTRLGPPIRPYGPRFFSLIYVCTVLTCGVLAAWAGVVLYGHVREHTGSSVAGLVAAITYALGTPTWEWTAAFFGHAVAGALLLIGFVLIDRLAHATALATRGTIARTVGAGAAFGTAIVVEFTSAIPVAILLAYGAVQSFLKSNDVRSAAPAVAAGAVAALMLVPLLAYNYAVFGNPFQLGYANVVGFEGMKTGFFGISAPKWDVLLAILFGTYRGVLWLSPVLVFAAVAVGAGLVRDGDRLRYVAIALVAVYYLMLNAGYAYWDGGESTGPRHITPVYPFLAWALGVWFARVGFGWRAAILGTLGVSVVISLACVSVSGLSPTEFAAPLFDPILPSFLRGDLPQSMIQLVFRTQGLWQLAPAAAILVGLGALLWREMQAERS